MPAFLELRKTTPSPSASPSPLDADAQIYRLIMADNKRNSMAGKVATPKVAAQPQELNDQSSALSKAIGSRVRVQTSLSTHEGTLFTADPISHLIAVNTAASPSTPPSAPPNQSGDYHIIPISHIQSFSILAPATEVDGAGFEGALPSISKLDLDALRTREETAVRKLKEKEATRNKAATKEGQEIFDNFARTLPTRWLENSIIVNDNVIIQPPYGVENLKANKADQNSLQHVRKVLEGYYNKKKAQGSASQRPSVATPIPPRKGG